jgi:hypothetical protein
MWAVAWLPTSTAEHTFDKNADCDTRQRGGNADRDGLRRARMLRFAICARPTRSPTNRMVTAAETNRAWGIGSPFLRPGSSR